MSTIKTLSFGICCALGGREGLDFAGNAASNNPTGVVTPRHVPPRFLSLQPSDVISRFCKKFVACKVLHDPPDWFTAVQDALASLRFVTSSLPKHFEELLDCVTKVQVLLTGEEFGALPFSSSAEVEALDIIHCLFNHLNKAVAAYGAPYALSGVAGAKIAAVQGYCRATIYHLSCGLHEPWHERLQRLLVRPQLFQHPRLQYVIATLLTEAEQALQNGCFTEAELATLTHAQNMAYDYAPLHPYVAQISELQAKHETVKRTSGSMTSVEGGAEPELWGREPHYSQNLLEGHVQSPMGVSSPSSGGLRQFLVADTSTHSFHLQPPVFWLPTDRLQRSDSIPYRQELRMSLQSYGRQLGELDQSHHSINRTEQSAEHHLYGGFQQHANKSSRQKAEQAKTKQPSYSILQRPEQVPRDQRPSAEQFQAGPNKNLKANVAPQERPCVEQQRSLSAIENSSSLARGEVVRHLRKYKENVQEDPQQSASQFTTDGHILQSGFTKQSTTDGPTRPMPKVVNSGTSDEMSGSHRCGYALHQSHSAPTLLRRAEELFLDFQTVVEQEIEQVAQPNTDYLKITESLRPLLDASLKLAQTPPYHNVSSLAALSNLHSSLLKARRKIENRKDRYFYVTVLQRRNLDQVVWNISRAWHQLRLIDLNSKGCLFPGQAPLQPSEVQRLANLRRTVPSFVVSQVYGALLKEDGVEEAVDNFFDYLMATSNPLDLPTAKVCLLILLYLKHENVTLIPQGGEESLDKLTAKLRHEVFNAKVTEISLFDLPEFIDFALKCYGADGVPQQGWQASLEENGFWPTRDLSPLVSKLNLYGKRFCVGLKRLPASSRVRIYANQINSLKEFYLQISKAVNVSEFEALFEQFSKFAEDCITECKENGHPASQRQLRVLEVTRDSLQWCRLLCACLRVASPDVLKEAYDKISTAWMLQSLWCREETLFLSNTDRASITKKILSVLESGELRKELLVSLKALLDQNVPRELVDTSLLKYSVEQVKTLSDDDKIINLLTQECRLKLADPTNKAPRQLKSIRKALQAALAHARLVVLECPAVPVPVKPLNANLRRRFVSSSASDSAARLLSLEAVLKDALEGLKPDDLTVAEVARQISTYLLGESRDEQWLDFIVQDVNWCSYTAQQLMSPDLHSEVLTLTENLNISRNIMRQFGQQYPNDLEATSYLSRYFANLVTLRWLCESTVAHNGCASRAYNALSHLLSTHVGTWIPMWLILMHQRQALFPSDVAVQSKRFEALYQAVTSHPHNITRPTEESTAALTPKELRGHLYYILRGVGAGTLTRQDIEILARKAHEERFAPRASANLFLAFLLYTWHNRCPNEGEANVVKECIKTVMHEISHIKGKGMSIMTMQDCLAALLRNWDA